MRKYALTRFNTRLLGALIAFAMVAIPTIVVAQDAQRKSDGQAVQRPSGETNVDIQAQGEKKEQGSGNPQASQGAQGPQGPAGAPGPQGAQGPAGMPGPSGNTILGMDATVALFVGLAFILVVIVAIVAASRGTSREA